MKTKHLFGLAAVIATLGCAGSARAGVSISFSFGLPVIPAPRAVVVVPPPCPPRAPVVVCPPAPRCGSVVYVTPRYKRPDDCDHRGAEHRRFKGRDERGRGFERFGRR